MELVNSASHSSCILIGQLKRKPSESCQKVVKKLSQTNQKTLPSGNGTYDAHAAQHCNMFSWRG